MKPKYCKIIVIVFSLAYIFNGCFWAEYCKRKDMANEIDSLYYEIEKKTKDSTTGGEYTDNITWIIAQTKSCEDKIDPYYLRKGEKENIISFDLDEKKLITELKLEINHLQQLTASEVTTSNELSTINSRIQNDRAKIHDTIKQSLIKINRETDANWKYSEKCLYKLKGTINSTICKLEGSIGKDKFDLTGLFGKDTCKLTCTIDKSTCSLTGTVDENECNLNGHLVQNAGNMTGIIGKDKCTLTCDIVEGKCKLSGTIGENECNLIGNIEQNTCKLTGTIGKDRYKLAGKIGNDVCTLTGTINEDTCKFTGLIGKDCCEFVGVKETGKDSLAGILEKMPLDSMVNDYLHGFEKCINSTELLIDYFARYKYLINAVKFQSYLQQLKALEEEKKKLEQHKEVLGHDIMESYSRFYQKMLKLRAEILKFRLF